MEQASEKITNISGILLAGGNSTRFQQSEEPWQDKALVELKSGVTILEQTILYLTSICTEVLVVVNSKNREERYRSILERQSQETKMKVRFVQDNDSYYCSGPIVGFLSGLEAAAYEKVLVISADLPLFEPHILEDLLANLDNCSIVVPYWPSTGMVEPLVCAVHLASTKPFIDLFKFTINARADDIHRAVPCCKFLAIKPELESLARKLFLSINERNQIAQITNETFPISKKNLFEKELSFYVQQNLEKQYLDSVTDFFGKYSFLVPDRTVLDAAIDLIFIAQKNNLFFYSGLIVSYLLRSFSKHISLSWSDDVANIFAIGLDAYLREADDWLDRNVSFFALHSFADAQILIRTYNMGTEHEASIHKQITSLKRKLNLKKKNHKLFSLESVVDSLSPDLLSEIHKIIKKAEMEFNVENPIFETDFLWDHSYRVAKIAFRLALLEGVSPLVPVLAALLHDSGKFILGEYHKDDVPEEEHSASIARKLLKKTACNKETINKVMQAIAALYNDRLACDTYCKIVHDADRLDKLGPLGIANFFIKNSLRGVTINEGILRFLSRELTYAMSAPKAMLTKTGRRFAINRSKQTIAYFRALMTELEFFSIANYYLKETKILETKVLLVVPSNCSCSGIFKIILSTEQGIKCEKLLAKYICAKCGNNFHINFCLPEVIVKN